MPSVSLRYTSHTHKPGDIRYRLVFPLSGEIPHELPAPEVMAEHLGLIGVMDMSKIGAASLFYLPSAPYDALGHHQTVVIPGAPIDAAWMVKRAGALLAARQAEADRIAAEAQAEAAARREAKIAAGFNPDDSLIGQGGCDVSHDVEDDRSDRCGDAATGDRRCAVTRLHSKASPGLSTGRGSSTKPLANVRSFDDFDRTIAETFERLFQLIALPARLCNSRHHHHWRLQVLPTPSRSPSYPR
jgi:hypothetical protein